MAVRSEPGLTVAIPGEITPGTEMQRGFINDNVLHTPEYGDIHYSKEAQSERLADFIKTLRAQDGTISDFDGSIWGRQALFVTVGGDKEITVTFRDGTEIQA